jgi:hypothetical protein
MFVARIWEQEDMVGAINTYQAVLKDPNNAADLTTRISARAPSLRTRGVRFRAKDSYSALVLRVASRC